MKIGMTELLVIFIVALFVFGPDRLPVYAKKLGEALAQFRKYADDATKDIKESIIEPLEEAQQPLRETVAPIEELDKAVRGNVKEIRDSFSGIQKKSAKQPQPARPDAQMECGPACAPEDPSDVQQAEKSFVLAARSEKEEETT